MSAAENIFLLTVQMLLGISLVLLILIGYIWRLTKDKIVGFYGIVIFTCFALSVIKWVTISASATHINIMENTWLDELMTAVAGLAYIYFYGRVFEFNTAAKLQKRFWQITFSLMGLQILYLLYAALENFHNYFNFFVFLLLLVCITLFSLQLLIFAVLKKNKSRFQKMILAGSVVFYFLVLAGNLSQLFFKTGKTGFNIMFAAFIVENIIFTVASAYRINDIYKEATQLKLNSYQYRLETEQVVNYFAQSISEQNTVDDLLWDVSKNLIGKLGFEDCMIYLWNGDKTVLLQRAGYGIKGAMQIETDKNKYHVPRGKGIVGATAESRQSILVNDTSTDSRYFTADNTKRLSELCVPILHNNETLGAINTEHSQKNFYTQHHLQILNAIAAHCADKIDKINAEEKTREKEIEVLKLNKDLATSQLTTLRAQMNPHFIFNALNSIQQYVLQGNVVEANKYLSKFSKLQREVLNHSDQDFISLEKEIEVLSLYLELEQLRFDGNFTYEIKTDTAIDDDEIKIPPMIIQPFVENSIWHGLMPRQGDRWVHIYFELNSDDLLVCTVTDNGIGRDASARLKQNGHAQHKSKGLSLVYDRLNILRQQYGQAFEVNIKDLVDENNVPTGTEVKLHIYTG